MSGELRERESLPSERELSGLHNISRTAVRIGLKQLEALGIVEGKQSSRRCVINSAEALFSNYLAFQPPTESYFCIIQDFRKVIEVGSVDSIIANADEESIEGLRDINEGIISSEKNEKEKAFSDYLFHKGMIEIGENPLISSLYGGMKEKLQPIWRVGKIAQSGCMLAYNTHRTIIETIEKGDADTLRVLLKQHLEEGKSYLIEGNA